MKKALLAATMLTLPAAMASAQPVTGLYVGAGAGVNWVSNPERFDIKGTQDGQLRPAVERPHRQCGQGQLRHRLGGVVSLGWGFGNGLRAEIEGNYRRTRWTASAASASRPTGAAGGWQSTYGAMGNVFYDFDLGYWARAELRPPYIGVGVGYVWTDFRNVRGVSDAPGTGGR